MTTTTNTVTMVEDTDDGLALVAEDTAEIGQQGVLAARSASRFGRLCQRGMISAEWAVGLIAAIAIAGVLVSIVSSGAVREALLNVVLGVIGWIANHVSVVH